MAVTRCLFTIAIIIFFRYSDIEGTGITSTDDVICRGEEFCSLFGNQLMCSRKLNNSYLIKSSDVENLILCHWADDKLDLSNILVQFSNVKKIIIQQSQISSIYSSSNSVFASLKELNVSNINLQNLTLPYLTELSSLDISHNLIEYFIKEQLIMMPRLQKLYLAGNPIKCSSEMQWLLNDSGNSVYLEDEKETFCSNDNYKLKPILGIMRLFQSMDEDCPVICKCSLTKVVGDLVPIISVNCNNLSLTRFPRRIPVNTTILLLKHNKELILRYRDFVKDINDIRCAYHEDDENSMLPIAELPITALCTDHSLPLHPLDYLSIIFASLTLLILGKLFYDWWYFKRTGKLPWLVANMP